MRQKFERGEMWLGDCLERMAEIPDGSVDMILCDLPYGTTQNKWDAVIPFAPLWAHYWRVAKPNAAIVLTAAQPFTSALVMSCVDRFKYQWVWCKSRPVGHLNAKKMPMAAHEDVMIFCTGRTPYNPQNLIYSPRINKRTSTEGNYGAAGKENLSEYTNYPKTTLEFDAPQTGKFHPTQKPVALFEYLIRTYTNPGNLVLDNCSGSGTTAVAAHQTDRRYLCIERDLDYYFASCDRVAAL